MVGKALCAGILTAAIAVLVGCHHDKRHIFFKPKDECVLPPYEPRFDNPPTAEYRKPPPAKDEKTLIGRNKMGGPGGFSPNGGF
jgi:hypothetical protein